MMRALINSLFCFFISVTLIYGIMLESSYAQVSEEETPQDIAPIEIEVNERNEVLKSITKLTEDIEKLDAAEDRLSKLQLTFQDLTKERRELELRIARESLVNLRMSILNQILKKRISARDKKVLKAIEDRMVEISKSPMAELQIQTNNPVRRKTNLAEVEHTVKAFRDSLIDYLSLDDVAKIAESDFMVAFDWYLNVQYELAEPLLRDYLETFPDGESYPQAALMLGDILKFQSRYTEAVSIFQDLIAYDGKVARRGYEETDNEVRIVSYAMLQDIYFHLRLWDESINTYHAVADQFLLHPEKYDGGVYMAGNSYLQKAFGSIRDRSGQPKPLNLGQIANMDSATSIFSQVPVSSPLYILAQQSIAQVYLEQDRLEDAIVPLLNVEGSGPPIWSDDIIFDSIWTAIGHLGHVYKELASRAEDPEEIVRYRNLALDQYGKVPEVASVYDQVVLALAWLEIEKGNTQNAINIMETLLDIRPATPYAYEAWNLLGEAYTKIWDYEKAAEVFSQLAVTERAISLINVIVGETRELDQVRRELQRLASEMKSSEDIARIDPVLLQLDIAAEKKTQMLDLHRRVSAADPLAMKLINYGQLKVAFNNLSGLIAVERAALNIVTNDLNTLETQTLASRHQENVWKIRQESLAAQQTRLIAAAFEEDVERRLTNLNTYSPPSDYVFWLKESKFGKVKVDFARYESYKDEIQSQYTEIGNIERDLQGLPEDEPLREDVEGLLADLQDQVGGIEAVLGGMRRDLISEMQTILQNYPDSPTAEPMLFQLAYMQYDQVERNFLEANENYSNKLDLGEDPGEAPLADYNTPIRTYDRFVRLYPNSEMTDQAYFQLGHLISDQGDLLRSNQMFETLVQRHGDSPLVPDAFLRIGDFYFDALYLGLTDMGGEELMQRAIAAYDRVLDYPDNRNYQNALYKLGWSFYNIAAPEIREEEYDHSIEYFTYLLEDSLRIAEYNQAAQNAGVTPKQLDPGFDLSREAIKYIAIDFRDRVESGREGEDRNWATRDVQGAMTRYVQQLGVDKPYAKPLMLAMADVYKETGQKEAEVVALDSVLALFPDDPQSPRVLQRMIDGYEDLQQMVLADPTAWAMKEHSGIGPDVFLNRARKRMFSQFGPNWARSLQDTTAGREALDLSEKALWRLANWVATQAEQGGDPASGRAQASEYYKAYLDNFEAREHAYTARWNYAQYMFQFENLSGAFSEFVKVSQHPEHDKYREQAALNAILVAEKMYEIEQQSVAPVGGFVPSQPEDAFETDDSVTPPDTNENGSDNP